MELPGTGFAAHSSTRISFYPLTAPDLAFLSLDFPFIKWGIIVVPTSKGYWDDKMRYVDLKLFAALGTH